jgi:hypothetical protein
MPNLPTIMIRLIDPFATCFYGVTTWKKAQTLLIGTLLVTGKRTVAAAVSQPFFVSLVETLCYAA